VIPPTLRDEINKRLSLNLLIQGAASHAGLTLQHLVRDELDALHPKLVRLYDQYALMIHLQFWKAWESALLLGRPARFFRRAASDPQHPFHHYPLLARHGEELAEAVHQRCAERWRKLKLWPIPFSWHLIKVMFQLAWKESGHTERLADIAKQAAVQVWGIPASKLEVEITQGNVAFGNLSKPRTFAGRLFRFGAVGYGGVIRRADGVAVLAKGNNWWLVASELVKGTAELICLHGLNSLSDESYQHVIAGADGIDFEPWMIQTGAELWRRLLTLLPPGRPVAEMLMHLARLPARSLDSLMLAVLEDPTWARELLTGLGVPEPDNEWDPARFTAD
jgi:hypothetical protein